MVKTDEMFILDFTDLYVQFTTGSVVQVYSNNVKKWTVRRANGGTTLSSTFRLSLFPFNNRAAYWNSMVNYAQYIAEPFHNIYIWSVLLHSPNYWEIMWAASILCATYFRNNIVRVWFPINLMKETLNPRPGWNYFSQKQAVLHKCQGSKYLIKIRRLARKSGNAFTKNVLRIKCEQNAFQLIN